MGEQKRENAPHIRRIEVEQYMPAFRELVESGNRVPLLITGSSMTPFLVHERDYLLVGPVPEKLKKGDMAFYVRKNGQYVMHRIQRVDGSGGLYFVGDAQTQVEGPVDREQVFGVVASVRRKGKWITRGSFWWEFFEHVWLNMIPLRPLMLKAYSLTVAGLHKRVKGCRRGERPARAEGEKQEK